MTDKQNLAEYQQRMMQLRDLAQDWIDRTGGGYLHVTFPNMTSAYSDLMFAFGLARLGAVEDSRQLTHNALSFLGTNDEVRQWLGQVFRFRISQASEPQDMASPLPADLLDQHGAMAKMVQYTVDRLRERSRILTPAADVDAYQGWTPYDWLAQLRNSLAQLARQSRTVEMAELIWRVYREKRGQHQLKNARLIFGAALQHTLEMGDSFARDLLREIRALGPYLWKNEDEEGFMANANLLANALSVAAHYNFGEELREFAECALSLMERSSPSTRNWAIELLFPFCRTALRQKGMLAELQRVTERVTALLLDGQDLACIDFRTMHGGAAAACTMLVLVPEWVAAGHFSAVDRIFDAVSLLLEDIEQREDRYGLRSKEMLATSYATALGSISSVASRDRLAQLVQRLGRLDVSYTTQIHYSIAHLTVIDAVVLATVELYRKASGPAGPTNTEPRTEK